MALTKCPDCSAEVSANAPTCPKCGSPIKGGAAPQAAAPKKGGFLKTCCLGFVGLMVLAVVASLVKDANMTPEEKKAREEKRAQDKAQADAAREKAKAEADAKKAQDAADAEAARKPARVGEAVKDRYFEVTVNRVSTASRIGNEFAGSSAGAGNTFLVMSITIKNVDTEARVFDDGRLWVTHGGKELEFDASETVLDEGWIVFENLNPLTTVTGNIAFKVPDSLPKPIYWQPGRGDKRILILE